jgi:hypothetical protein
MSSKPTARVLRIELRTARAFAQDDPLAVSLLRLMAATNDVRQLRRLITECGPGTLGRADELVQSGELLYYVRLFLGHLYEAGKIFGGFDPGQIARISKALEGKNETNALTRVRGIFADVSETGFYKGILAGVRNLAAFHYKDATFRDGAAQMTKDAELVIAKWAGFSRYAVTDSILEQRVLAIVGGTRAALDDAVHRALELAEDLEAVVSAVARHCVEERPGVLVRPAAEENVSIPPHSRRRRSGVKKTRREQPVLRRGPQSENDSGCQGMSDLLIQRLGRAVLGQAHTLWPSIWATAARVEICRLDAPCPPS